MSQRVSDERLAAFLDFVDEHTAMIQQPKSLPLALDLRDSRAEIVGLREYLNDICDAYEAWDKAVGSGPDDAADADALAEHDGEVGARWDDLIEALDTATHARQEP